MKKIFVLFLVIYLFVEISGMPEPQSTDNAQELLDGIKTKMQEAWDQAQNKTSEVFNKARDFFRNTFSSAQQAITQNEFIAAGGEKLMKQDETKTERK